MKKMFLLFSPALLCTALCAQNVATETIRWHIDRAQEVNSGKIVGEQDQVVSYGVTKIEWQDARSGVKKTFTISETNGSWSDIKTNGSILYEVNEGTKRGTVAIIRNPDEFLIRITLIKADDDPDIYELAITDFETL
jgi:hypothetical protein